MKRKKEVIGNFAQVKPIHSLGEARTPLSTLRKAMYRFVSCNSNSRVLIYQHAFGNVEALAQCVDFMLPNPPYNIRGVRDEGNWTHGI